MKKLLVLLITVAAGLAAAVAQEAAENAPVIAFKELAHDFGVFPEEAGSVTHTFEFTNTGKSDLVVQNVRASCGCTTPSWTRTPIRPGETGTIEAAYNPANRPGAFNKSITVITNAGEERLRIKGEVIPKAQTEE